MKIYKMSGLFLVFILTICSSPVLGSMNADNSTITIEVTANNSVNAMNIPVPIPVSENLTALGDWDESLGTVDDIFIDGEIAYVACSEGGLAI
ncbi:MAG: hypothetical protein FK733_11640, partial [Asgard group archaeon]|nr:hypothetical protein [Asgard group archaeon]